MNQSFVLLAIPFFFALMGVEWLTLRVRGIPRGYRFSDSIANLCCGLGQQVLEPFFKVITLVPYTWLWTHARLVDLSPQARGWWGWVLLIVAADFGFYVFHRASHRVGFLWAVHAVHHQSEELNLSVALRQPWFRSLFAPFFYLPLAVLGFPPLAYVAGATIANAYQFWLHTRSIGKLGPLEWFLNTPSTHRVHHGIDPEYIDRNFGGVLVIWDRLFGTFTPERREPVYGTVTPVRGWDACGANVSGWLRLARMSRATRRLGDKLRVWIAPPEWKPADLGGPTAIPPADRAAHPRYDVHAPRFIQLYVSLQFAAAVLALTIYLRSRETAPLVLLLAAAAVFIGSIVAWGKLLERAHGAWRLELARLAAAAALVTWIAYAPA